MKKKLVFILIITLVIIISVLLVIYFNRENLKETIFNKNEEQIFKISLEDASCNSKEKSIYTYEDGRVIYSRCGEIYYSGNQEDNIKLGEALKKKYITIEDITKSMEEIEAIYDGGTIVYEYNSKDGDFSTNRFRLEVCKKRGGSHDQLFLSADSNDYKCAK